MVADRKPRSIFLDGRSWPLFHLIASLFLVMLFALHWFGLDAVFDTRISSPILFQVREMVGRTQDLNPRVKILALDDSTFSYLGGPRLSYDQLEALLRNIAARKPKAILIDSLLADTPFIPTKITTQEVDIPVYSGSFMSGMEVQYRLPSELKLDVYKPQTYLHDVYSVDHLNYKIDSHEGWYIYGHSHTYDHLIRGVGHITFNSDATISPFFLLGEKTLIPHLSLFAADSIQMTEKKLLIDGHVVPLTRDGRVMINHRNPNSFYKRAAPLKFAIQRALNHEVESKVNEGDVVVILFAFATGNTDFHEGGPFGPMPGGMIIASMVSDVLDGTWLTKWETDGLLIVIFGFFGIIVGINLSIRRYLLALIGVWSFYTIFVVACFIYGAIWCPWAMPMLAFTGTSLIHFVHVRIYEEMKLMLIERNYQLEKAKRLERTHGGGRRIS
ncbi:MAG: CHASE2 domain-containing protein [Chitinophagaceae bacterium]|nr:CHASE2 domain-containing protein [Oligoflexus sp.]